MRLLRIATQLMFAGVSDKLLKKHQKNHPELTLEDINNLRDLIENYISKGIKYENSKIDIHNKQTDIIIKLTIDLCLSEYNNISNTDINKNSSFFNTIENCINIISTLLYLRQRYPKYNDEDIIKWYKTDLNSFKTYNDLKRHFDIHKDLLTKDDNNFVSLPSIAKETTKTNKSINSLPTETTINGYIIKKIDSKDQIPTQEWIDLECDDKYCITTKNFFGEYGGPPYFWVLKKEKDKYIQKGMIIPNYFDENMAQALRNSKNTGQMLNDMIKKLMPFLTKHGFSLNNAITTRNKEIVQMAVDAGAKPNKFSLDYSIIKGDKEIIQMVLDANVKPDKKSLDYAIDIRNKEIIQMILNTGAKPSENSLNNAIRTGDKEIIQMALNAGAKPNENSLYNAIRTEDKKIIQMVLDAGAKLDEYSLYDSIKTEDKEIIQMILDAGAKPNRLSLDYSIKTKNKEIVQTLLDADDKPDEDVLDNALMTKNKEIVQMILDAGAEPSEDSLNFAITRNNKEIVQMLLNAGAKPDEDALNEAIRTGSKERIKMVLDAINKYNINIEKEKLQQAKKILEKEPVLAFNNTKEAIQYLADFVDNKIIITSKITPNKDGKFIPPKGAQKAAQKVIKWKEKYPDEVKAMTKTGWTRARQLANREPLSLDIVKRMAKFYRHKSNSQINPKYKGTPWKDNGYVAWEGWGGDIGINWAKRVVESQKD